MLFRYKIPATACLALCLLALWPTTTTALFSTGFQTFLNQKYGATIAKQLIRSDLGINGSFGGNVVSSSIRIFREPVILVHGLNQNASGLINIRDFFNRQNYGISEVYATSYGPDGATIDASSTLQCSYAKQLRNLIAAVSAYTGNRKVAIIAYSLGATVARKAVLGGICVDTKEDLKEALTNNVSIFISVAGANLGAAECTASPTAPLCGATAGLKTGSAYLKDINSKKGYEGQARYSIGSKTDEIVGFSNLSFPAAQINVTLNNFAHGDTIQNTLNIQASLLLRGYVTQRTVDKDSYAESQLSDKNCTGSVDGGESFQLGPHESQQQAGGGSSDDENFPGEYNRQAKVWHFLNGFNYTRHSDPTKGKFFTIRNKRG